MIQNLCIPQLSISECFLASVLRCSRGCWGKFLGLGKTTHNAHLELVPWVITSLFSSSQHPLAFPLLPPTSCLSLTSSPVWSAVKTAVKHNLISTAISQGNQNEKILPTFSLRCHTTHRKCWQETPVPSLTFYRALRTHSHTSFLLLAVPLNQHNLQWCGGI